MPYSQHTQQTAGAGLRAADAVHTVLRLRIDQPPDEAKEKQSRSADPAAVRVLLPAYQCNIQYFNIFLHKEPPAGKGRLPARPAAFVPIGGGGRMYSLAGVVCDFRWPVAGAGKARTRPVGGKQAGWQLLMFQRERRAEGRLTGR